MNPSASQPERPYRLLISYAHENEAVKDRLKINLAPLQRNGWVEIADDSAIPAEGRWREEIEAAIAKVDVVLFLLDEYFLASGFCKDTEVADFLLRQQDAGVLILFILTDHCCWKNVDFISNYQLIPSDTLPISSYTPRSRAYTRIADEIADILPRHPQRALPLALLKKDISGRNALAARLPGATARLFGRDTELEKINVWHTHKGVLLWVGDAGTGKSALIHSYLMRQADDMRFMGCTFHSHDSARNFLLNALMQMNVLHDARATDDELGRLLACAIADEPAVLILDGIETLQYEDGKIKDRGLTALLEALVRKPGQSLCLVSSRISIPEPRIARENYFREETLGLLSPDAARTLLRCHSIRGDDAELGRMAKRCGRHPSSLLLAAEFCHSYLQNHAADFVRYEYYPKTEKADATTVMDWLDNALTGEHQTLDRELLRILGLFDRPAPWGALLSLRSAKAIPGLSVALHAADETTLTKSLARIKQWGLLFGELSDPEPGIGAHALVREHFAAQFKKDAPKAWQTAHSVLFDWFSRQPEKHQPDSLKEMAPLYRAIVHGGQAGRYRTAYRTIYLERILHGDAYYSQNQLGAYSTDLHALATFFPQGWSQPPVTGGLTDETLGETDRTGLLAHAAFALKSSGRLEEAIGPQRIGHQRTKASGDWNNFCRSAENLVSMLTPLGRWVEAEAVSREAVSAANLIDDKEARWQRTTTALACLGQTLHGRGFLAQASTAYSLAEMVQRDAHHHPKLYSVYGYNYAQLLLEQASQEADWREVLRLKNTSLDIVVKLDHPLSQALDHSAIGLARAALGEPDSVLALDLAVTTMQRAGTVILLPAMHLARAHYLRSLHDLSAAWVDFELAHTIARRSNMRTYLAECALLGGNLCLDEARTSDAAAHYATALQLISEDGYGRRMTEIHLLHARLLFGQPAAVNALNDAKKRILETGQWYFWRDLRTVAAEIGVFDPGECPLRP